MENVEIMSLRDHAAADTYEPMFPSMKRKVCLLVVEG